MDTYIHTFITDSFSFSHTIQDESKLALSESEMMALPTPEEEAEMYVAQAEMINVQRVCMYKCCM